MMLFVLTGCNNLQKPKQTLEQKQKELDAGELDSTNTYTVEEVGWTAALPNWKVLSKRENHAVTKKGKELVEKTYGATIDDSKIINLVSIQKNPYTSFMSTMEQFDEKADGNYDDNIIRTQEMIKEIYKSKKIPAEYALGAVRIDGVMFDRFEAKVFSPDRKKVILEQKMFNAAINGYILTMTINFNNSDDEETLMGIVTGSKFSKKK